MLHDLFDLPTRKSPHRGPIWKLPPANSRQPCPPPGEGSEQGREDEAKRSGKSSLPSWPPPAKEGNFNACFNCSNPEILLTADDVTKSKSPKPTRPKHAHLQPRCDARVVAETFKGRALAAFALINGSRGTPWIGGGKPRI